MLAAYSADAELRGAPTSFRQWQKRCHELGIPPVIAVAGSRGKSTVVRLLQAIFNHAGMRSAIWTDHGVEINGRRQSREIAGWNRALTRITERSLDVAIQELDWNLVAAVGLPQATYPIGVITNVCNNSAGCLQTPSGEVATRALPRVAGAIHGCGFMCVNGEDYLLDPVGSTIDAQTVVVAKSSATPLLRQHQRDGGECLWISDDGVIVGGHPKTPFAIARVEDMQLCMNGNASFQQTNALLASAAALATGIGVDIVGDALLDFDPSTNHLPGSFSVRQVGSIMTVVDRTMPSWFLRPVLRAANPQSRRRQITVLGGLSRIPEEDVFETGRLLGRSAGAVILHGEIAHSRLDAFRRGIAQNRFPPVLVHLPTERRAINRAIRAMRGDDVVLFLCDEDPGPALRAVDRM